MKKTILFFTLLTLVAFSSCEKLEKEKDFDKDKWEKDYDKDKDYDKEKEICFELVYPVTYTMPDGSSVTGDNEEAIETGMKNWYEANPDSEEKPSLNYPVDVTFEDGETKTIENEDEMILLKKYCEGKEKKWDCFELVYPVTYTMPDGTSVTGDNEEAIETGMKNWYEANSDSEEKPSLNYPVDIILKDGETKTIENEDEMIEVKKTCKEAEDEN